MRTKTATIKKSVNWEEFKTGLEKAGFERPPLYPEWLYLKKHNGRQIIVVPGNHKHEPITGSDVYEKEIHVVWFSSRDIDNPEALWLTQGTKFPASIFA